MADASLSLTYTEYLSELGVYLGWGTSPTGTKLTDCHRMMDGGLRKFYSAYDWRFRYITTSLSIGSTTAGTMSGAPSYSSTTELSTVTATTGVFTEAMIGEGITFDTSGTSYEIYGYTSTTEITVRNDASGEASGDTFVVGAVAYYDLPDNFWRLMQDSFYFTPNDGYERVVHRDLDYIQRQRGLASRTGKPMYCAIKPKTSTGSAGERWEVVFYPTPDSEMRLWYQYRAQGSYIRSSAPYPLGGAEHAETIKAFILAEAEYEKKRIFNGPYHQQLWTPDYQPTGLLAQSIRLDGEQEPGYFGMIQDISDDSSSVMDYHNNVDGDYSYDD